MGNREGDLERYSEQRRSAMMKAWMIPALLLGCTLVSGARASDDGPTGLEDVLLLRTRINNAVCFESAESFSACMDGLSAGLALANDGPYELIRPLNEPTGDSRAEPVGSSFVIVPSQETAEELLPRFSAPAAERERSPILQLRRRQLEAAFRAGPSRTSRRVIDFEQLLERVLSGYTDVARIAQRDEAAAVEIHSGIGREARAIIMNEVYSEARIVAPATERDGETPAVGKPRSDFGFNIEVGADYGHLCDTAPLRVLSKSTRGMRKEPGCWSQDPMPSQWNNRHLTYGAGIVYRPWKLALQYLQPGTFTVDGTFVEDPCYDPVNRAIKTRPEGCNQLHVKVKQRMQMVMMTYSPEWLRRKSVVFSTPMGMYIYKSQTSFQGEWVATGEKYYCEWNRECTYRQKARGAGYVLGAKLSWDLPGTTGREVYLRALVQGGPSGKKDAPCCTKGSVNPGLYNLSVGMVF